MTSKSPKTLDKAIGAAARGAMNVMRALTPGELASLPGKGLDKLRAAKAARRRGHAPDWQVRCASAEDLPRLRRLQAVALGREPASEAEAEQLWSTLVGAGGQIWLLESGLELAGAATLYLLPGMSHGGQPLALLQDLLVDPASRDRGVARLLITELSLRAQAAGARRLALSVEPGARGGRDYIEKLTPVRGAKAPLQHAGGPDQAAEPA
ncbi:GNAT family N-acetyltransferase [Leptothrix discophora]|uniref:GNAT family N-acetyltransferase n=1 Tax=Leptothrix discophora TaxID=89 RepID=A0ABT9G6G3_LEPDI|nr:GNAT family N-acetyltransferase [Leptothrix discophora]MDP4302083.1 GNAT family N-acetyltransferase [Leptothrix discophora]